MSDYVIISDLTMDLPSDLKDSFDILTLPMDVLIDDKVYSSDSVDICEFYEKIRQKVPVFTTQINPSEFEEYFSKYFDQGKDIIYLCLSSKLSGMYNSACLAMNELKTRFPERKLRVIDSLSASLGMGYLAFKASKMRSQGAGIDETADWLDKNKHKICHWFVVDDLYHLKRGGRISGSTAFVGSIMNIKPILKIDKDGALSVCESVRGRKKAFATLISKLEECIQKKDMSNEPIYIAHADCEDDAKFLAEEISKKFGIKNVVIHSITPVIGAHTGADTLAIIFPGIER